MWLERMQKRPTKSSLTLAAGRPCSKAGEQINAVLVFAQKQNMCSLSHTYTLSLFLSLSFSLIHLSPTPPHLLSLPLSSSASLSFALSSSSSKSLSSAHVPGLPSICVGTVSSLNGPLAENTPACCLRAITGLPIHKIAPDFP